MFEEAPIDSQRHCRQQLCCWFSWGQISKLSPKKLHSIRSTEYNCHTKSQSKNPSKTKETTCLAETLVPTSKLCEVWASEIRVFGGHTNFQFENSLQSNCVSVFRHFDAFSCILQFSTRHGSLRFCTRGHAFFSLSSVSFCSS